MLLLQMKTNKKIQSVKSGAGFSLLEILIVLALFTVLGGMALVVSMDAYRSYAFSSEQDLLVSLLQKARSQSQNNIDQSAHGLSLAAGAYTLFEGSDYAHRNLSADVVFSPSSNYALSGLTEVIFSQMSATTTAGEIVLNDNAHPKAAISLNYEGQINLH